MEARVIAATEKLHAGKAELDDFVSFSKKGLVSPGSGACWEADDNALLGIQTLTEAQVKDIIKAIVS